MAYAYRTVVTPQADIRLTETDGTGMPLLMLHGSGLSRAAFDKQLHSQLAERYRLIAMDLPGHGESSDARDPSTGYTLPGLADAVGAVLQALKIDRVAVFGWSLGGHVGIELLSRYPSVTGLMLMGTPPVAHGPLGMLRGFHASWDMLLASKEHFAARDVERYAELCFGHDVPHGTREAIRRTDGRIRPTFSRSMMRGDGADQKQTVETAQVPIALVNGEHDPFVRLSYIAGLDIPALWDNRAYVLENAGHAAFRDQPERFNALLMRFAADVEAWRAPAEVRTAQRA